MKPSPRAGEAPQFHGGRACVAIWKATCPSRHKLEALPRAGEALEALSPGGGGATVSLRSGCVAT